MPDIYLVYPYNMFSRQNLVFINMNASNALMSICNAQNNSFVRWRGFTGKLCEGKDNKGYDRNIPCLYMAYAINTQKWIYSAKIVMNLQSCVRTSSCMYI